MISQEPSQSNMQNMHKRRVVAKNATAGGMRRSRCANSTQVEKRHSVVRANFTQTTAGNCRGILGSSLEVIRAAVNHFRSAAQKVGGSIPPTSTIFIARIFRGLEVFKPQITESLDQYAQTPMGEFLLNNSGGDPLAYGDKTLTTGYKNELSKLVLKNDYAWEKLNTLPELVRITKAVYSFIEKHNRARD